MTCDHDFVLRDAFTDKNAVKVPICKKCNSIGTVIIQGEKKTGKPPATGVTIGRMSVLKAATDIEIQKASLANVAPELKNILALGETLEAWVYRQTYE